MITRDAVDQPSFIRQISGSHTLPCPGVFWKEVGGADEHPQSRLEAAVICQPACRSGPWLASGHLDLEKVLANKSPSRCLTHLVQTVCSTLHPAFLLRVWSFGTCQAECA